MANEGQYKGGHSVRMWGNVPKRHVCPDASPGSALSLLWTEHPISAARCTPRAAVSSRKAGRAAFCSGHRELLWLLSLNFYAFPLAASTWCLLASESILWSQCWQQRPGVDSRTLWPAVTARASLALAPFLPHSPHNFSAASQSFWDPSYNPWLLAAVTRVFLRMTFRDGFSHCPEVFLAFLAGLRADHDND